ncbi:hypothetical protein [Tuberibacillus sp. Marseille-P3662]|uniref:hypothetical protein n=1 Tax=Tuberibacillus sp. Marseille-P3662 TaxID=1965358 RepID=UPI00159394F9|nr:hypothetical protein [Tuberibacillus sp. Marseille-P3662]
MIIRKTPREIDIVEVLDDDWVVLPRDDQFSAYFENTIAIADTGPECNQSLSEGDA